ncbi:hypothetical protein IK7_05762 [Bacillus cereus VD156]|nr:hypothetical protein IK7_05762 [Bacillus cereus VD156]
MSCLFFYWSVNIVLSRKFKFFGKKIFKKTSVLAGCKKKVINQINTVNVKKERYKNSIKGKFSEYKLWVSKLLSKENLFIQKHYLIYKLTKGTGALTNSILVIIQLYALLLLIQITFKWSGLTYPANIHSLGKVITDLLKYILPITITVYTFSYRERKQIASSIISSTRESIQLNFFIVFSVSSFLFGLIFYAAFDSKEIETWIKTITVWYLLVLLSVSLLYLIVRRAFRNINILKLLPEIIELTNKEIVVFKEMMNIWDGKKKTKIHGVLKQQKKRIHAHTESVYQMLGYMNEKNMNLIFEEMLTDIKGPLGIFNSSDFFKFEENETLNEEKLRVYIELYQSILSNHGKLIVKLFNDNKIIKGKEALRMLIEDLKPKFPNNVLYQCYNQELFDLTSNFKLDDLHKFNLLLESLNTIDKEKIEKVYQNLILRAVESKDVKFLCNIVYSVAREEEVYLSNERNPLLRKSLMLFRSRVIQKDIHLILKAILKSIELGHHSCAGFLIKFLITRFNSEDVRITLEKFSKENATISLDFSENEQKTFMETDNQRIDFNFNPETFEYCFYKMIILIYGQQKYSTLKKLPGDKKEEKENNYVSLLKLKSNCEYIEYLLDKILNRKNDYGLLYIKNNKFMFSLKRDLKRK